MNVQNILKVADAIEAGSIPDLGFNMEWWNTTTNGIIPDLSGHNCGTVACIGGWTEAVLRLPVGFGSKQAGEALGREALGLDRNVSRALFFPENAAAPEAYFATPAQAVRCLRHLAATFLATGKGEVDWPRAMGEAE